MKIDQMIGRKFGRLTVEAYHSYGAGRMLKYTCQCECGGEAVCYGNNLRNGNSQSCGCLCIERTIAANTTHGMRHEKVWQAWMGMKNRCYVKTHGGYKNYGGRGIIVCDRWRHSFENFYTDMGDQPSPVSTLDRIDNDGDYEPSNCRWASYSQQNRNRRNNRLVEIDGETHCIAEWVEILGIKDHLVKTRMRRGWSAEKALTTPRRKKVLA